MIRPKKTRSRRLFFIIPVAFALPCAVSLLLSQSNRMQLRDEANAGLSRFERALLDEQDRQLASRVRPRGFAPDPERAPFGAPIAPRYLRDPSPNAPSTPFSPSEALAIPLAAAGTLYIGLFPSQLFELARLVL